MIAVGLIASNRGDEILRRRLLVGVGLLKIEDVLSARFEQAIDVEHRDARLRLALAQPFQHYAFHDHAANAGAGQTRAEEQHALVLLLRGSFVSSAQWGTCRAAAVGPGPQPERHGE
jgi:hypothetical protein